jgi:hypothetical protein
MTETAPGHEWEFLRGIDPMRDAHKASLLTGEHREGLFSSIVEIDREPRQTPANAALAKPRLRAFYIRSRPTGRRRLWAAIGASGSAVIGGMIAIIVLLSSTASIAYAGWSSTPSAPTAAAVASATAECNRVPPPPPGSDDATSSDQPVFVGQPALSEARGIYTAVIAVTNGQAYGCLVATNQGDSAPAYSTEMFGAVQPAPDPDHIGIPYRGHAKGGRTDVQLPPAITDPANDAALQHMTGAGYGDSVLGQAGAGVQAVSFTFADGNTVTATVENGWYFAWWPWISTATSVTVTTGSGTNSSPVTSQWMLSTVAVLPKCQPGSSGCVFSETTTPTATTPATTQTTASPGTTTAADSTTVP